MALRSEDDTAVREYLERLRSKAKQAQETAQNIGVTLHPAPAPTREAQEITNTSKILESLRSNADHMKNILSPRFRPHTPTVASHAPSRVPSPTRITSPLPPHPHHNEQVQLRSLSPLSDIHEYPKHSTSNQAVHQIQDDRIQSLTVMISRYEERIEELERMLRKAQDELLERDRMFARLQVKVDNVSAHKIPASIAAMETHPIVQQLRAEIAQRDAIISNLKESRTLMPRGHMLDGNVPSTPLVSPGRGGQSNTSNTITGDWIQTIVTVTSHNDITANAKIHTGLSANKILENLVRFVNLKLGLTLHSEDTVMYVRSGMGTGPGVYLSGTHMVKFFKPVFQYMHGAESAPLNVFLMPKGDVPPSELTDMAIQRSLV